MSYTSYKSYRSYVLSPIPQRRKLRKWIFTLPRVRQQIDQRAIGNRLAPQIDKRAIDKGIARKSPLVSSVPLSLHTRLSRFPYEAPNDGIASRTLPVLAENPLAVQGRKNSRTTRTSTTSRTRHARWTRDERAGGLRRPFDTPYNEFGGGGEWAETGDCVKGPSSKLQAMTADRLSLR